MGDGLRDEDLESISRKFPDLKQLFVQSRNIIKISFNSLEVIECVNCVHLESLKVVNAFRAICTGCMSLGTFEGENTIVVDVNGCRFLKRLNLPHARILFAGGTGIEEFHASKAKWIYRDGTYPKVFEVPNDATIYTQLG